MKTSNYFLKVVFAFGFLCLSLSMYANNSSTSLAQGDLTLQINFDNNHEDIHWVIFNSDYNAITAGGPYYNQTQNSSMSITLPSNYFLSGNGNYNIVFYDKSGAGMGNGSYTLTENGNIIAQHSSFTYSQATTFSHGNVTPNALDVTPPTNPLNPRVTATTNNSISLEWDASTDSESLWAYQVVIDNGPYASSTVLTEYTFPAVAGTSYDVTIFAYDRMGNICVQPAFITASIGNTNNCASGNLSLDLDFSLRPNEVAWQIKDNNYNVVEASSNQGTFYYDTLSANSSITETINQLSAGDYILVIYDANGDGGTTYSLSDANTTLASGTTTGYSDVIQFCVGNTSTTLDAIAPTDPLNLNIVNTTSDNRLELTWDASTDNVAVTEYGIFLFNSSLNSFAHYPIGITNTNTYTTPPLPSGSNFITVVARDKAGNFSNRSNSVLKSISTFTTLHEGFFETGWDGWTDGGRNAARPSNYNAYEGSRSARLRNGTNSSKITLSNQALSGYTAVEFSFYFKAKGVENNESFILEYYNGNTWNTIESFSKSVDFNNNQFYKVETTLSSNDYAFSNSSAFRIRMQGNQNNDRIFVDQTKLVGINGGLYNSSTSIQQVSQVSSRMMNNTTTYEEESQDTINEVTEETLEEVRLYPNPTSSYFKLSETEGLTQVNIFDISGTLVKTYGSSWFSSSPVFIVDYPRGSYIVKALYGDIWKNFKLIVR